MYRIKLLLILYKSVVGIGGMDVNVEIHIPNIEKHK